MKTIQELAKEAIDVQDACNLSGVARSFARVMSDLREHGMGTSEANYHPIARAWIDKMASLAGIQHYTNEIDHAHQWCLDEIRKGA